MRIRAAAALVAVALASGCAVELPEKDSNDAKLYAARCSGGCHAVIHPHSLTAAMWKVQLDRMDKKIRSTGLPAPTGAERERILSYLVRNSGG